MTDHDDENALRSTFQSMMDTHFFGPDEPQEDMTFQPGERVRIIGKSAASEDAWSGLLCRVIKSYHNDNEGELSVLIPLEKRPDFKSMGEDQWFVWQTVLLSRA